MAAPINCSSLAVRTTWNSYARNILDVTGGNVQLLDQCRAEVCVALWGEGNSDISGIGTIVGYTIANALGLALSVSCLCFAARRNSWLKQVCCNCLDVFSDCAAFFSFSIQIAAIIVLVREDFGNDTGGMGDDTVIMTQAVSMVVLLPLLYPFLAQGIQPGRQKKSQLESAIRFGQLVGCWLLALYPFFSKMNAAFGPSRIRGHSSPGHSVLTAKQFDTIQHLCFGETRIITVTEDNLMTAFVMLAYIPLSLFILGRILWLGLEEKNPDSRLFMLLQSVGERMPEQIVRGILWGVHAIVPLLAGGLLWSIMCTRKSQEKLAASVGSDDPDRDWGFGQIVAVTLFMPVIVEVLRTYRSRGFELEETGKEGTESE